MRIPTLGDGQFAALRAKAGDGEHAGHRGPGHLLLARLDEFAQQGVQAKPPPQRQTQEGLAEIARALHTHPAHIDQFPARPLGGRRRRLAQLHLARRGPSIEQRLELIPARLSLRLLAGELAQSRDDLLARPLCRAH